MSGGERGIRTLDGLLTHTPLAGERLQPLGHLSENQIVQVLLTLLLALSGERVIPGMAQASLSTGSRSHLLLPSTPSGPSALRFDVPIRSRRMGQPLGHLSGTGYFIRLGGNLKQVIRRQGRLPQDPLLGQWSSAVLPAPSARSFRIRW